MLKEKQAKLVAYNLQVNQRSLRLVGTNPRKSSEKGETVDMISDPYEAAVEGSIPAK